MVLIEPPRSTMAERRDPLNRRELARFAGRALRAAGVSGTVAILLTGDRRVQKLNRQFRRKNAPTDVLSFPAAAWNHGPGARRTGKSAGDLAISLDTAARQAERFGHSLAIEVQVLILHGALHLAGFDHETDSGEMARVEDRLRAEFGLPSGLIGRSCPPAPQLPTVATRSTKSRKSSARSQKARGRSRHA